MDARAPHPCRQRPARRPPAPERDLSLAVLLRAGLLVWSISSLAGWPATVLAQPSTPAGSASAEDRPATLRLDYYHSGTASEEHFSFDRLVVEPLPWPGPLDGRRDTLRFGKYFYEVFDTATGELLYSRGFASIYGEWETTGEAKQRRRTFHESVRFPAPVGSTTVELRMSKRGTDQQFHPVWQIEVDPEDMLVQTAPPARQELLVFEQHGDSPAKVDLLVVGDGYTQEECPAFEKQARRYLEALFAVEPFRRRRDDFNVWGLCPPAERSGVARPSTGVQRRSPMGASYDAFRSERYVLTFENRTWRDIAAWAPYELVLIVVNNDTYGGGGIYNLYATVAGGNDWSDYVAVHELGHHIAGLADEYYTSDVAYESGELVEPWEANATALLDPEGLKWGDLVEPDTPVPTPWPKEVFEEHSHAIQERRRALRAADRPESEMSALFEEQAEFESRLLGEAEYAGEVGAFEGANYSATGYYRPQVDCIMFTRDDVPFCAVCERTLEAIIDQYARPAR